MLRPSQEQVWRQALVTGASSGIGAEIARQLAATGIDLVLVARRDGRLRALSDELRAADRIAVEVLVADLTTATDREQVEQRLGDHARPIDLLVNAAGGCRLGPVADKTVDAVRDEFELNLGALAALSTAAITPMVARGTGTVLNIAGGTGLYPVPGGAAYSAAKAAVINFTAAVAHELAGTGVTASVVCPGFTRTEAQATAGIDIGKVPARLIDDPARVATAALRAAAAGRVVTHVGWRNRLAALGGRHLPHRLLIPATAAGVRRVQIVEPTT